MTGFSKRIVGPALRGALLVAALTSAGCTTGRLTDTGTNQTPSGGLVPGQTPQ